MKQITITVGEKEPAMLRDALNDAAIALRTNHMTGVVMGEKEFLSSNISEMRRVHYLTLKERANQLSDFVRLA